MEAKSNNGSASERSSQSAKDSQLSAPDELISFAQEYFSSDFPNPERLGCPTTGILYALVRAGKVPDDKLRAHLFGCSECFHEYRTAVLARNEHPTHVAASSWSHRLAAMFKRLPVPIYASAIALILLSLVSLYFWRGRDAENAPLIVRNDPAKSDAPVSDGAQSNLALPPTLKSAPSPAASIEQPTPAAPSTPAVAPSSTTRRSSPVASGRNVEQNRRELLAMNTVAVDLENYTALRGDEENTGAQRPIKLATSRTRLNLSLPEGSLVGRYTVSIVNAAGETLATVRANSTRGTAASVVLNLTKFAPGQYRLRVARDGERPDDYPVTVGN